MESHPIIFIIGPTAAGKSDAAIALARGIRGEIISCDSMQIYKEISIASGKPSREILARVPHHLLGAASVTEEFDVAAFRKLALRAVTEIHERNHVPLVVGGSGLYARVLLDGIFEGAGRNAALRQELRDQAAQRGPGHLYEELKKQDPEAAGKIHAHDLKRIIRALEVCQTRGVKFSELQKAREGLCGKYPVKIFGLQRNRAELYQRIEKRVDAMFEQGIVDEIRALNGIPWSLTADRLIGVKEIKGYLRGEYDLQKARDLMKLNTRHFAKRQMTWFRKDSRIQWISWDAGQTPEEIAEKISKEMKCQKN